MRKKGFLQTSAFVAGALALASGASAARLGHPAYSASAATAAQKQWNIVADPGYATDGSTTTLYSPSVASVRRVDADGDFYLVKVLVSDLGAPGNIFEQDFSGPVQSYTFNFTPSELTGQVGAIQVFWSLVPATAAGVMPPKPAYSSSLALSADEDTHNIVFDNLSSVTQTANFTNYQNPGTNSMQLPNYFPEPDFYEGYFEDPESEIPPGTSFMYGGNPNGQDPNTMIDSASTGFVTSVIPEPGPLFGIALLTPLLLMRHVRRPEYARVIA